MFDRILKLRKGPIQMVGPFFVHDHIKEKFFKKNEHNWEPIRRLCVLPYESK